MTHETAYGRTELKAVYQYNMLRALVFSAGIVLLGFSAYHSIAEKFYSHETETIVGPGVIRIDVSKIPLPPSVLGPQGVINPGLAVKATRGIPVPVPDGVADPDATIPTQDKMGPENTPLPGTENGSGYDGKIIINPKDEPAPGVFIPYDKDPCPVVVTAPEYPELARKAGLEGNVYVKVLVSAEGKVKKGMVVKSDGEIFNQPAMDAIMKCVFTPALAHNNPVAVWVVIPVKFRMRDL